MTAPIAVPMEITLTDAERLSDAWRTMKAKIDAQLEKLRAQNDNPNLTADQTATLRGHIQCLKALRALDKKPPEMTAANTARPTPRRDHGEQYG